MGIIELGNCGQCITSGCMSQTEYFNLLNNGLINSMLRDLLFWGIVISVSILLLHLFRKRLDNKPVIYNMIFAFLIVVLFGLFLILYLVVNSQ